MRYAGLRVEWRLEQDGIRTDKTASYNGNEVRLLNDVNKKNKAPYSNGNLLIKSCT